MDPSSDLSSTVCVVTGGVGFIVPTLVPDLPRRGAPVRVVDALIEGHGGDPRNVDGSDVEIVIAEIGADVVGEGVRAAYMVFNLAGQVSHLASMRGPLLDLHVNTVTHASFLETLRRVNPAARVV